MDGTTLQPLSQAGAGLHCWRRSNHTAGHARVVSLRHSGAPYARCTTASRNPASGLPLSPARRSRTARWHCTTHRRHRTNRRGELTKRPGHEHVMLAVSRVWERYGDDKGPQSSSIGAATSRARGAIAQYIQAAPADPGDERFVLPPGSCLRRVTSVFVDGDDYLNVIGAFLCIICAVCTIGSTCLGTPGCANAGGRAGGHPVTGGFPWRSITCSRSVFPAPSWPRSWSGRATWRTISQAAPYRRRLPLRARPDAQRGGLSRHTTPIGTVSGARSGDRQDPGADHLGLPQTADGWAYGIFSGGLSGAFAVIHRSMVAFGYGHQPGRCCAVELRPRGKFAGSK